jgi:NADH dehydrogenase
MILVVGDTGVLGKETVERLVAGGHPVRALVRAPARAAELKARGVEVVAGDLLERRSLVAACAGADRVFAAAHALFGRSQNVDDAGHRALIDAARAAGATRFVYTSALGASPDHPVDFFRTKHAIEQYLRDSGMPHAILRPSAFMEWHAHAFNGKPLLDRGHTVLLGSGAKRRNFVAARDVAAVAVQALTSAEPPADSIEIGGSGNLTDDEVANLYARCAGIEPRVRHVPVSLLRMLAPVARVLHPGIGRVLTLATLAGDETFDGPDSPRHVTGKTSLEEFVRERVAEARLNARLNARR